MIDFVQFLIMISGVVSRRTGVDICDFDSGYGLTIFFLGSPSP